MIYPKGKNKMEKIAIITDSCGDVPQDYKEKYDIFVLPIVIECGQEEFKDGIDITAEDVYEKHKNYVLKTASPAGKDIMNVFEEVYQKGYTHAIAIMLSSGLSGTCNQVRLFAENQDDLEVAVYNSKSGSIGYGSIAIQLAKYRNQGMSFKQLTRKAENLIQDTYVFFSIDSLEHLQKGGRIGKATAFVGSALKIKPILTINNTEGEIDVPAKVRGNKKVLPKLVELIERIIETNQNRSFNLLVADGAMPLQRDELEKILKENFPTYKGCIEAKIGAALSCYLGPGLLGAGIQFLDN